MNNLQTKFKILQLTKSYEQALEKEIYHDILLEYYN